MLKTELENPISPEEVVILVMTPNGEVRINDTTHPTLPVLLGGGFVGILAGLMLFNPALAVIGGIAGSGIGAILGALKEVGIDDAFMEDLARSLKPGSSALLVRIRPDDAQRVVGMLDPYSQKILQAELAHNDETKLQAALREVQHA
jgi:uncharacterized membrane protein